MAYVLVASSGDVSLSTLQGKLQPRICSEVGMMNIPELKHGSFDGLVQGLDEVVKADSAVESIARRIERQLSELDSEEPKIHSGGSQKTIDQYIRSFSWDESKFPTSRSISEHVRMILSVVQRLDEKTRIKGASHSEVKNAATAYLKNSTLNLATRDLTEVFSPSVVQPTDLVDSEHLKTVLVVVPRGGDKEFLKKYESLSEHVIAGSAKKFDVNDSQGSMLFRVVVLAKGAEDLKAGLRANRWYVRDFTYDPAKHAEFHAKKQQLELELTQQEEKLKSLARVSLSDTVVAWAHLKAIRVFVECVLRYGVPPRFQSFLLKPAKNAKIATLRKQLDATLQGGSFGQKFMGGDKQEGDEDYFNYVSLNFTPLLT